MRCWVGILERGKEWGDIRAGVLEVECHCWGCMAPVEINPSLPLFKSPLDTTHSIQNHEAHTNEM